MIARLLFLILSEEDSDIDEDNHKHDHLLYVYVSFSKGVQLFKSSKLSNKSGSTVGQRKARQQNLLGTACSSPRVQCNSRGVIQLPHHIASAFRPRPNCSSIKAFEEVEQRLSGKTGKMTLLYYSWGFKDYKADTKPQNFLDELLGVLWKMLITTWIQGI
ncbi:hypothetical protein C5167_036140 [Papaver somniferum]|nr:hypothetical protein C5167_036140 [Papaver somniferum]